MFNMFDTNYLNSHGEGQSDKNDPCLVNIMLIRQLTYT